MLTACCPTSHHDRLVALWNHKPKEMLYPVCWLMVFNTTFDIAIITSATRFPSLLPDFLYRQTLSFLLITQEEDVATPLWGLLNRGKNPVGTTSSHKQLKTSAGRVKGHQHADEGRGPRRK